MAIYENMLLTSTTSRHLECDTLCDIVIGDTLMIMFKDESIMTTSHIVESNCYSGCWVIKTKNNVYKFVNESRRSIYHNMINCNDDTDIAYLLGFSFEGTTETDDMLTYYFNREIEHWEFVEFFNITHPDEQQLQDYIGGFKSDKWSIKKPRTI